jgi:hypothetical protein
MRVTVVLLSGMALVPHSANAAPQLTDLLAKPMLACMMLEADDTWQPRLDEFVQNAIVAQPLGAAWNADSAGWRQARAALGKRVARVTDAYRRSPLLHDHLEERLSSQFTPAETAELAALLAGPAGATILRQQIELLYVSDILSEEPDLAPSDPRFQTRIKELRARFADKMAADVPADDPAHKDEATAFLKTPLRSKLHQTMSFVGQHAQTTLGTQIQLMLFDDQEAIGRELEAAVATARRRR